ncbi:MAG: tetratricopeptide repeat protein [Alphaproteobacteria bacterium]|nr:tetratricopeptide repeat protein [Alphaproteobacteria bacterium]
MADQVQDNLLREIDEELRQEKYPKLWKRYGSYIIAVAVIIVGGVAGYQGWRNWDIKSRMEQSDRFEAALEVQRAGDLEAARNAFVELSDDAGAGYATLARFHETAILAKNGDRNAAIESYEQISEDTSVTEDFRNLAIILGAMLELDSADPAQLTARLEPLADAKNPWRFSALEITGLLALRAGDTEKARKIFTQLSDDATAPQGIRGRAAEMLASLG